MQERLRAQLTAKQGERKDEEMAALIGCSRAQWSFMKSGRRRITMDMMDRLTKLWPDLALVAAQDWIINDQPVEAAS